MLSERAASFAEKYRVLEPVPDTRVFGRDPSNPYYDLLYWVANDFKPSLTVELGTCTGGSTSNLAAGSENQVISIDVDIRPGARERLAIFPNIELIHGDTRDPTLAANVAQCGPIDLLFIDTDHVAEQVKAEMSLYGSLVRPGGLILLDDIRMHPCMSGWWDELDEDKLELPDLHWTSFGAVFS
ncbi:MAG: class I SAM-dependent methyltransferase [Chlorobia bacterium]|nr:class I SAM-dependent methyltransferase [Fimbriimonadaceae bacterium]